MSNPNQGGYNQPPPPIPYGQPQETGSFAPQNQNQNPYQNPYETNQFGQGPYSAAEQTGNSQAQQQQHHGAPPQPQYPSGQTQTVPSQPQYPIAQGTATPPRKSSEYMMSGASGSLSQDHHHSNSKTDSPKIASWKARGKKGFDVLYNLADKLGAPTNKLSNKIGSESFWPTSIDKESEKAARILRSFAFDGVAMDVPQPEGGPKSKQRVVRHIPPEVIANARGLAIFTTMRTGWWVSGAGGSGILIARLPDGSWSPPSGIVLHVLGVGFLIGIDIYDCVVVLNTDEAVQAFASPRFTLGGEFSAVAGPYGAGGVGDVNVKKEQDRKPVWSYIKSRGFYAGAQVDGTIIIERGDENEKFYHERLKAKDIIAGKVRNPPMHQMQALYTTLAMAQGTQQFNSAYLPQGESPSSMDVQFNNNPQGGPPPQNMQYNPQGGPPPQTMQYGTVPAQQQAPYVPNPRGDDPYGVQSLQSQGVDVHPAGQLNVSDTKPSGPIY